MVQIKDAPVWSPEELHTLYSYAQMAKYGRVMAVPDSLSLIFYRKMLFLLLMMFNITINLLFTSYLRCYCGLLTKRYMMNDLHLATPTIIIECYHGSIDVQQNKNNKTGGGGQKGSVFFGVCRLLFDL